MNPDPQLLTDALDARLADLKALSSDPEGDHAERIAASAEILDLAQIILGADAVAAIVTTEPVMQETMARLSMIEAWHRPRPAPCPDPDVPGDCWVATRNLGCANKPGQRRAVIPHGQRTPGEPATTMRWFWGGLVDDAITDLMITHACGRASCVNPGHTRPGTPADNAADARRHAALRDEWLQ